MSADVASYVERAPREHREALVELQDMIVAALPTARATLEPGFPVYTLDDRWVAGFASRSGGPTFYLMMTKVLDGYRDRLGRLATGRSCVAFQSTKDLSLDDVRRIIREMLGAAGKTMKA